MNLILVGYVLHVLACAQVDGEVTHDCRELPTRSAPTNLYTCQSKMAVAVERVADIDGTDLGLKPGSYHFDFECRPASGRV